MRLNYLVKRCVAALMSVLAIAFVFFSNPAASIAAPNLLADAGSRVQGKVNEDTANTKSFVRKTADTVKDAARSNASKVDRATDGKGGFVTRKAKDDAAYVQKRANEDASRTQGAINKTRNVVDKAVDGIKDAFGQ